MLLPSSSGNSMSEFTSGSFHDDDVTAKMHRSSTANAECDVVASSSFSESWQSDVQQSHMIILSTWKPLSILADALFVGTYVLAIP
jgi:hypothetical protein